MKQNSANKNVNFETSNVKNNGFETQTIRIIFLPSMLLSSDVDLKIP